MYIRRNHPQGRDFLDISAGELALLKDPITDKPLTEYTIDTRRCVVKSTKGAIRPAAPL